MGDLIVMTRPNQTIRRDRRTEGGAEVLFFTGVRYARIPEADSALAGIVTPHRATKPRRGPSKNGNRKRA